jgi:hypothetical protein
MSVARVPTGLRIYIQPQPDGQESYLAAAIVKKHVPAIVTQNRDEAQFLLTAAAQSKEESTGSKIARCPFIYCIGMEGMRTVTVQLVRAQTNEIAWAYTVNKGNANAFQSTAESVAKHLKQFLEQHPQ